MGFASWFRNAASKVKHAISSVFEFVKKIPAKIVGGVKSVAHTVGDAAKSVGGFVKNIGTTVCNDVKGITTFAGQQVNKITDIPGKAIGILSNPLFLVAAGGVALVAFKVMSNKPGLPI